MPFPTRAATSPPNAFAAMRSAAAAAGISLPGTLSDDACVALCVANLLEGSASGTVGVFSTLNATGLSTLAGGVTMGATALAVPKYGVTVAALGTTQNSTPTAAQLLGGVVTQTGETGGGTVTTPTGAVLSAAIADVAIGMAFQCLFMNLGGGQTLTITAGATGMTIIGTAGVGTGKSALLTFVNTAADTWSCYCNVSA